MLSMTGFSSLTKDVDAFTLQVDIKAVNSKYSDLRVNASFCDNNFLEELRKCAQEKVYRGQVTVDLTLKIDKSSNVPYNLNIEQVNRYINDYEAQYGEINRDFSTLKYFLQLDHVTQKSEYVFDAERDGEIVKQALTEAFNHFYDSRAEEGQRLKDDLLMKVAQLSATRTAIAERVPELDQAYRERLEERMRDFIKNLDEVDESRILAEVAVHATKTTIDEELVRLQSHLDKLATLLNSTDQFIGKKIDFYMQEINREYNTIASKVSDILVAEKIVESKVIVDQIREQAQNIM